MPWLGTVDSSHWTADFRLARLLEDAHRKTGRRRPIVVVGLGLSLDRPGTVGPTVGQELAKVYPYVFGTPQQPVARHNVDALFFRITHEFPEGFVLVVDGSSGAAEQDRHVVAWSSVVAPDEEFLEAQQALMGTVPQATNQPPHSATLGEDLARLPFHVGLIGVVGPVVGSPAAHARGFTAMCDAVIDGILRFFYRTGQLA